MNCTSFFYIYFKIQVKNICIEYVSYFKDDM